ncbi:UNKNOWN [Stylonychia lemnae]|uniref:Uncharacterized protein n=1 Tax=Stylonychia lemnae TaxID=5949 RepID=A0A078AYQ7_STYLE|nr:UNKNOWN [Stylonychia lemnae]|eukprot:CDW87299.1 UNKNOWN [Stylonychia lemnae]
MELQKSSKKTQNFDNQTRSNNQSKINEMDVNRSGIVARAHHQKRNQPNADLNLLSAQAKSHDYEQTQTNDDIDNLIQLNEDKIGQDCEDNDQEEDDYQSDQQSHNEEEEEYQQEEEDGRSNFVRQQYYQQFYPQQFGNVKMITICGYLDSLQTFIGQSLNKQNILLKDQDKKDFTKVFAQVPKRKPQIKNFVEDDPRLGKIQQIVLDKIFDKTEVDQKRNFISKYKVQGKDYGQNMVQQQQKQLKEIIQKYTQIQQVGERQQLSYNLLESNSKKHKYRQVINANNWIYENEIIPEDPNIAKRNQSQFFNKRHITSENKQVSSQTEIRRYTSQGSNINDRKLIHDDSNLGSDKQNNVITQATSSSNCKDSDYQISQQDQQKQTTNELLSKNTSNKSIQIKNNNHVPRVYQ